MEVLVVRRRLCIDTPILEDLQGALLNFNRLDQHWLKRHQWEAKHSDDNNFIDEDVADFLEFCRTLNIKELFAAETQEVFASSGVLNARAFPPNEIGLSQALYGLSHPLNVTHQDANWILAAAMGVSLIFSLERPLQFLILRDGGGVVTIAGTKAFINRMTQNTPFRWMPGLPCWVRPKCQAP